MNLADQIIEHGPYYAAQLNPITAPTAAELNALREELIAAGAVVDAYRKSYAKGYFRHPRGPVARAVIALADLDELNRRAAEHAEECR